MEVLLDTQTHATFATRYLGNTAKGEGMRIAIFALAALTMAGMGWAILWVLSSQTG